MVKTELAKRIAMLNDGLSEDTCRHAVDAFFNALSRQLVSGGRIALRDFGHFSVVTTKDAQRRNPQTGETITVACSCRVRFGPGKRMMKILNQDS